MLFMYALYTIAENNSGVLLHYCVLYYDRNCGRSRNRTSVSGFGGRSFTTKLIAQSAVQYYPLFSLDAKIRCLNLPTSLFLGLFKNNMLAQFGAVFLELDLLFDFLLVLARPIDLAGLLVL